MFTGIIMSFNDILISNSPINKFKQNKKLEKRKQHNKFSPLMKKITYLWLLIFSNAEKLYGKLTK